MLKWCTQTNVVTPRDLSDGQRKMDWKWRPHLSALRVQWVYFAVKRISRDVTPYGLVSIHRATRRRIAQNTGDFLSPSFISKIFFPPAFIRNQSALVLKIVSLYWTEYKGSAVREGLRYSAVMPSFPTFRAAMPFCLSHFVSSEAALHKNRHK
jgi:hypothetical protein